MKTQLEAIRSNLLDPQAVALLDHLQWWDLPELGIDSPFPVAVLGQGQPLLLLHGFDSSFLEYRRLAPLLSNRFQLFIPDLFGFGFSPRPRTSVRQRSGSSPSAECSGTNPRQPSDRSRRRINGGAVAVEIARHQAERINTLLLLAPAGLTGRPMPVPPLLDRLGAWFLSRPGVRRGLCRQAFADPDTDVGPAEEQIASLHLQCPGWSEALAAFARSGGFSGSGHPLPQQPCTFSGETTTGFSGRDNNKP